MQCARRAEFLVENGIEVSKVPPQSSINNRDETGPERRRGCRTSDDRNLSIDTDPVSSRRIGRGGYIFIAPTD